MTKTAVSGEAQTIGQLRRQVAAELTQAFAGRGYNGTPALDARLLVARAIGVAPLEVPLRDNEAATAALRETVMALAARRARGEPVARIVGVKEFHGLDFTLSGDTLVPRPETETLVEAALAAIEPNAAATIVDLGTGSGAILLAVLERRPRAYGIGVDISPGAVRTARDNARHCGLAGRARFVVGNWMDGIGSADFILANPPYIETGAIERLDAEVREYDPRRALDGGIDGLAAIRPIITDLGRVLAADGRAFIEIGAGQAAAVSEIGNRNGFSVEGLPDLAGLARVAVLRRR